MRPSRWAEEENVLGNKRQYLENSGCQMEKGSYKSGDASEATGILPQTLNNGAAFVKDCLRDCRKHPETGWFLSVLNKPKRLQPVEELRPHHAPVAREYLRKLVLDFKGFSYLAILDYTVRNAVDLLLRESSRSPDE